MATNIESLNAQHEENIESLNAQHEELAFQFLIFCVVLAAMLFGLIHAVIYFTDSTGAAARDVAKSVTATTTDKAILVSP